MGCFPERASAHLPGYINGPTVGIDGEQRGVGEINIRADCTGQSRGLLCLKMSFKKVRKVSHTSLPRIDPHKEDRSDRSTQYISSRSLTKE